MAKEAPYTPPQEARPEARPQAAGPRHGIEPGPPAHWPARPSRTVWEPARALWFMAEALLAFDGERVLFLNQALARLVGLEAEQARQLAWPTGFLECQQPPPPVPEGQSLFAAALKRQGQSTLPVTVRLVASGQGGASFAFITPLSHPGQPGQAPAPARREPHEPDPGPAALLAAALNPIPARPGRKLAVPSRELNDLADALLPYVSPLLAQPRLSREDIAQCLGAAGKVLREFYVLAEDDLKLEPLVGLSSLPAKRLTFLLVALLDLLNHALVRSLEKPGKRTILLRLCGDERDRVVLRVFSQKCQILPKLKASRESAGLSGFLGNAVAARGGALLTLRGRGIEHRLILPAEESGR